MSNRVESVNDGGSGFPSQNLPYAVFSLDGEKPRCGVAIVDLDACETAGLIDAGQASSVLVSGTAITCPMGQLKREDGPIFASCEPLDIERPDAAIGAASRMGERASVAEAEEMIFGYVPLNDWSARGIQGWECQPHGPFQAKAFATTINRWIVTREALEPFRKTEPECQAALLDYLQSARPGLLDIALEVDLSGATISRANYGLMYHSSARYASSGCPMRIGDALGSGTISGPDESSLGLLLEMTQGGKKPLTLADGSARNVLEGDGYRIGSGAGSILGARN